MENNTSILCQIFHRLQEAPSEIVNGSLVTFLNPYTYLFARKRYDIYGDFTILVDGMLLVYALKLAGFKNISRRSFDMTSLAPKVFEAASVSGMSIYFIGAKPNEINVAVNKIASSFPQLKVIGYQHGYVDGADRENLIQNITKINPDIIVCGMGGGIQEQFLLNLKAHGWKGTGYTCGGFLHQTAKRLDYYPAWADKLHMRWVYRIYDEPKLIKRYFFQYPLSLLLLFFDVIRCRKAGQG